MTSVDYMLQEKIEENLPEGKIVWIRLIYKKK